MSLKGIGNIHVRWTPAPSSNLPTFWILILVPFAHPTPSPDPPPALPCSLLHSKLTSEPDTEFSEFPKCWSQSFTVIAFEIFLIQVEYIQWNYKFNFLYKLWKGDIFDNFSFYWLAFWTCCPLWASLKLSQTVCFWGKKWNVITVSISEMTLSTSLVPLDNFQEKKR